MDLFEICADVVSVACLQWKVVMSASKGNIKAKCGILWFFPPQRSFKLQLRNKALGGSILLLNMHNELWREIDVFSIYLQQYLSHISWFIVLQNCTFGIYESFMYKDAHFIFNKYMLF